jgi:dTDP-4-amino-4,6-dideoxygalactose transaminase
MKKPVLISLSPNTTNDDVLLSLKLLLQPDKWRKGAAVKQIEDEFKNYLDSDNAYSFNSGRSGLYTLVKSFGIGKGDEVVVQSFTCVAVPNSVLWTKAEPVYADIEANSFNISLNNIKRKITKKTKAVIVQHTFGQPAEVDKIKQFCEKNKLLLIEDCAHSLGQEYHGRKLGTFGDAAMFSFGRDKIISSVFGGMAVMNNDQYKDKLKDEYDKLVYPKQTWVLQQLLHPPVFLFIKPFYNFPFKSRYTLGKGLLVLMQKLGLLSFPVCSCEKKGHRPDIFPKKMPNCLAELSLHQFQKLSEMNEQREKTVSKYLQKIKKGTAASAKSLLRFPVLVDKPYNILKKAQEKGILLGDWYFPVISPSGVSFNNIGYKKGCCPIAESASSHVINLPTYPGLTEKQINTIINLVNSYL